MAGYNRERKKPKARKGILMVALYGAVFLALFLFARSLDDPEPEPTYGSLEGRFTSDITMLYHGKTLHYRENEITNYVLIGVDRDKLVKTEYQNGGQADFILVLSIDRRNRTITPVMIDRDAMADVTTYGIFGNRAGTRKMQICLAQAFSGSGVTGSRNTLHAVEKLLGNIRISRYLLLDLDGIAILNDAVGGVPVTLEDDLTALSPVLKKGDTVMLRGNLAEHFVRGRTTVADGTNASRMLRQRTYIEAFLKEVTGELNQDSEFIVNLLDSLSGHLESDTDEQLLINDVNAYKNYEWQPLVLLPGMHVIGEDGFAEFWIDENAAADIISKIWFS